MEWDFNSLRIFGLIAQTHSMTAAATALDLTPSTVSKAMTKLESELGVRLLHRTTRSVHLTAEGVMLLERYRVIQQELDDASIALSSVRSDPKGRLRVLISVGFGRQIVVPTLLAFNERYPSIVLDVELSDRRPDLVHEGLDLAVTVGPPDDAGLVAKSLGTYDRLTCAAPAYLEKYGEPTCPADLLHHKCLAFAYPQSQQYREWKFTKDGHTFVQPIAGYMNINHAESLIEFAIAGAGIVQVSAFVMADAIRKGVLKTVLTDYASQAPDIYVSYPPNRNQSARVRAFIEHLEGIAHHSMRLHKSTSA